MIHEQEAGGSGRTILKTKTEYFKPLDHFLPKKIHGEKGFSREGPGDVRDMFRSIVSKAGDEFDFGVRNKVPFEKAEELGDIYVEIMAVFFYHLSHRLAREEIDRRLNSIKPEPAE